MRETVIMILREDDARRFLKPDEGMLRWRSRFREFRADTHDIHYGRLLRVARELQSQHPPVYMTCRVERTYTEDELEAAELFYLRLPSFVSSAGELCGTRYDDSAACRYCGAGGRQVNELRLDADSLRTCPDIVSTDAYVEVLFSARLVEALAARSITGARFLPVLRADGGGPLQDWYQLEVTSPPVRMGPGLRFGLRPFGSAAERRANLFRCPLGHVAGPDLVSELSVRREDWDGSDLCVTRQRVGFRSNSEDGVARPYPLLLISQKVRRLLGEMDIWLGASIEVAHLV